jgi:CheY-like chemotaxis protein
MVALQCNPFITGDAMKKRAVVIDDESFCRYSLSKLLQKKGYDVICSDSAVCCELHKSSVSTCSKEDPCGHFFLTDNRMPGMNGLMLIARQRRGACRVPMAMKAVLSGGLTPDELDQAQELGCKVFHKPYDLDEISDWLDQQETTIVSPKN